nr:MAG TPA_asm: hypothetical protein [Caudoviricetes sp.]
MRQAKPHKATRGGISTETHCNVKPGNCKAIITRTGLYIPPGL